MHSCRVPREAFSHCDCATGKSVPYCQRAAAQKMAVRGDTAPIGGRIVHTPAKACCDAAMHGYWRGVARGATPLPHAAGVVLAQLDMSPDRAVAFARRIVPRGTAVN